MIAPEYVNKYYVHEGSTSEKKHTHTKAYLGVNFQYPVKNKRGKQVIFPPI